MKIGKAFGAAAQPEAEFVDIEIHGPSDVLDQQADIRNRVSASERHG
jgi:hypothetical protein